MMHFDTRDQKISQMKMFCNEDDLQAYLPPYKVVMLWYIVIPC